MHTHIYVYVYISSINEPGQYPRFRALGGRDCANQPTYLSLNLSESDTTMCIFRQLGLVDQGTTRQLKLEAVEPKP